MSANVSGIVEGVKRNIIIIIIIIIVIIIIYSAIFI
jgi:hypothetical protein